MAGIGITAPYYSIGITEDLFPACGGPAQSVHMYRKVGVQTDRIISDCIRIRIQIFDTDIRYPNICVDTDTDMVLNFNYPYPNSSYIPYILIYIMKIFMYIFMDIRYPIRICIQKNKSR
jgi:hypothetical protein